MRREIEGLVTYRFDSLGEEPLAHAVFTRLGGVSQGPFATLNVGHSVGDEPAAVAENHARIYAHLALSAERLVTTQQTHGNRVAVVSARDAGQVLAGTDGLVTDDPDIALMLRFADCQPILLFDPEHRVLALLHAGWRGVAQGIARRGVETMQEVFDCHPDQLIAGLGPAIGPCCYAVGHDVASTMGYALPHWRRVLHLEGDQWRFDLPGANVQQLEAAGVHQIERANLCTACHTDEFFSHRGDHGPTGRFAVVAHLRAGRAGGRGPSPGTHRQAARPAPATDPDTLHPPGLPPFQEVPGGSG